VFAVVALELWLLVGDGESVDGNSLREVWIACAIGIETPVGMTPQTLMMRREAIKAITGKLTMPNPSAPSIAVSRA
jgi:hypothetical protein